MEKIEYPFEESEWVRTLLSSYNRFWEGQTKPVIKTGEPASHIYVVSGINGPIQAFENRSDAEEFRYSRRHRLPKDDLTITTVILNKHML